jgi:hypothetical protein
VRKYAIPCDLAKCSGASHFYFLPSCPPGIEPVVDHTPGRYLHPDEIPHQPDAVDRTLILQTMASWEPPPEPTGPIDLEPFRKRLESKSRGDLLSHDISRNRKGELLKRCLRGEQLAGPHERNNATTLVAGIIVWTLPDAPISVVLRIMRPSVDAMIAAGSSLKHQEVERMVVSAMKKKAEADARGKEIERLMAERRANIPVMRAT